MTPEERAHDNLLGDLLKGCGNKCFTCGEELRGVFVHSLGEKSAVFLHPECAIQLGVNLIGQATIAVNHPVHLDMVENE